MWSKKQAVNTLVFNDDGSTYADNTDGVGLAHDLMRNHKYTLRKKNILLLGAGGAARGIIPVLLNLFPTQLVVANRSMEKAIELGKMFQLKGHIQGIGLDEIEFAESAPFDLIINATSAGLKNEALALPSGIVNPNTWCYDLCYGEAAKPFLAWAQQQGAAQSLDGLGMLVEQAAAAFYLWYSVKPRTQEVIEMLCDASKKQKSVA